MFGSFHNGKKSNKFLYDFIAIHLHTSVDSPLLKYCCLRPPPSPPKKNKISGYHKTLCWVEDRIDPPFYGHPTVVVLFLWRWLYYLYTHNISLSKMSHANFLFTSNNTEPTFELKQKILFKNLCSITGSREEEKKKKTGYTDGNDARYRIGVEATGGVPAGRSRSIGSAINCRPNRSASSRIVRRWRSRGIFCQYDRQQQQQQQQPRSQSARPWIERLVRFRFAADDPRRRGTMPRSRSSPTLFTTHRFVRRCSTSFFSFS